jgi:hypothetical protein
MMALVTAGCSNDSNSAPTAERSTKSTSSATGDTSPASADSPPSTETTHAAPANTAPLSLGEDGGTAGSGAVTVQDGGTINAVGADGTTFTLTVAPFVVAADTTITVTPLSTVSGVTGSGAVHAVRLGPDGLTFVELPTLTIVPAAPIAVPDQLMFVAKSDGSEAGSALVDAKATGIVLLLEHFSVAGAAEVTSPERAAFLERQATAAEDRISSEVGAKLGDERIAQLTGQEGKGVDIAKAMDQYEHDVVAPRLEAASSSCAAAAKAIQTVLGLERQRQLLGMGSGNFDLAGVLTLGETPCEKEAIAQCKAAKDPSILIRYWLGAERTRQLLGMESSVDLSTMVERAKSICLPHSYSADGGADEFHGTGTICDLAKPFTIAGSGITVQFTPTSETAGSYSYTGSAGGATLSGNGAYTASVTDQGGTITASGTGTAETPLGVFSADGTEIYNLTVIDPC